MSILQKGGSKAIYYPAMLQAATSQSAAAGTKTKFYRTREKYEITSGCSSCGKSKKEIKKALGEGTKKDYRKKLEELRKQGFPAKITIKV